MHPKHLLLKEGILKEFSIRKAFSNTQFEKLCNQLSQTCKTQKEFQKKLNEKIVYIDHSKIPGSIPLTEGERQNALFNKIINELVPYLCEYNLNEDDVYRISHALEYCFKNKEIPWFRFFNEDGTYKSDENDDDVDDSESNDFLS